MGKKIRKACAILMACIIVLTGIDPVYATQLSNETFDVNTDTEQVATNEDTEELDSVEDTEQNGEINDSEDAEIETQIDQQSEMTNENENQAEQQSVTGNENEDRTVENVIVTNPLYEGLVDQSSVVNEIKEIQEEQEDISWETAAVLESAEKTCGSYGEAVGYLREQMVNRENSIVIRMPASTYKNLGDIFNAAIECTESSTGQQGDALIWVHKGYGGTVSIGSGIATLTYSIPYYTTRVQESALTSAVNTAIASLNIGSASEYQKVKAIHDYICNHVDYEYTSDDEIKYTAYAAMCTGKAVCQGYAVLFYRMCKDVGLSVRLVAGLGNGGAHGWNIVRIGSYYYDIDTTWDGQDAETYYTYFLKCESDFGDHVRRNEYNTAEFNATYPMTTSSWVDYNSYAQPFQADNYNFSYTTLNEQTVSTVANGRPKLLIYYSVNCGYSRATIQSIAGKTFENTDIIAIDTIQASKDSVNTFKNTYGNNNIIFTYDTSMIANSEMWQYCRNVGLNDGITYPVIVYIDANNKVQYATTGYYSAGAIQQYENYYCKGISVTLAQSSINLEAGKNYTAEGYVSGEKKAGSYFSWSSSNTSVATVNGDGVITGISAGNCVITCKVNNNNYATMNVNVTSPVVPSPIYPTNRTIDDGIYTIESMLASGMLLDINGAVSDNGANLQLWKGSQKFKVTYVGDGKYSIMAMCSGKFLDAYNNGKTNGTNVIQYAGNNGNNQKWYIVENGDGSYRIQSALSGLCLDVTNNGTSNGTNICLWSKNGGKNQCYKFNKVSEYTRTVADGVYKIQSSLASGMLVDVNGAGNNNGANVQLWRGSQSFKVTYTGDGKYSIMAMCSGKYLDAYNNGKTNGTNVIQYAGNNGDNQRWYIEDAGSGHYYIRSALSGLCMDVANSGTSNGTNICLWSKNGGTNQKFDFNLASTSGYTQTISDGTYQIESALASGMLVDINGAVSNNGANVQLWKGNQRFKITYLGDGKYSIMAVCSNKYLDAYNNGKTNGTNVIQYAGNGGENQKWYIEDAGGGYYYIKSATSGLCMDVANAGKTNGTNICLWSKNGGTNQKFKFK